MSKTFDYKLFGLEPRDIKVYEAMLQAQQPISIRSIADTTHMNRGTAFEVIKKLVRIGLVGSQYKQKRKYYAAQDPSELQKYADHMQNEVAQELLQVGRYVRELKSKQPPEPTMQFSKLYEGEEEIAALLRDVLAVVSKSEDKEYCVISSAEIRNHLYGKFRNFTRQRIKLGIFVRVIGVGQGGEEAKLAERRWLSTTKTPACYIILYGNKVAYISLTEGGEVQGAVVQNEGMAVLQSLIFERLWEALLF